MNPPMKFAGTWLRARRPRFLSMALAVAASGSATPLPAEQAAQWSVETPTGPTKDLAFEATEGTWMSVSISPDGRWLAFDLLGHIYEMPMEGGVARPLTSGRSWNLFPRYSPDGRQVAFSSDRAGNHDVWVMDRKGGAVRNLSASPRNTFRPTWSPDGRRIYASTTGDEDETSVELVAFNLVGGRQTLVQGGNKVGGAVPEPAGTGIFFERHGDPVYAAASGSRNVVSSGARIERYDQATGEVSVHIERPGGAFAPALSPDGRQLAYVNRSIDETILIVQDLATKKERVLFRGLDRDRQSSFWTPQGTYPAMSWHPDGRRLVLGIGGQLSSVDVARGKATRIPFRAPVQRQLSRTMRFPTVEREGRATTRSHRWGSRTPKGILFEALGDLWIQDDKGARRNLTRSAAHETSPVYHPRSGALYYASWTDDTLGAVYRSSQAGRTERLTSVRSQYGSLAVSPDGAQVAYVRGSGGLERGLLLHDEGTFDLVVRAQSGAERWVTAISGPPPVASSGKLPPVVMFGPTNDALTFTEFQQDGLVVKRIGTDGAGEKVLFRFPNALSAVPSPDFSWIAFREYQRTFITPFAYAGQTITISAFEKQGFCARVDPEDGGYVDWSPDGRAVSWTRGTGFYEKRVDQILAEAAAPRPPKPAAGASWTGARVPGSTARRTELAIELDIDSPKGAVALSGARVVTMNPKRHVLEKATVLIQGSRIAAVGEGVAIPAGAKVFDLTGHTIIPGLVDVHAHPRIGHSALHVIEQRPWSLSAPLAYGVTTLFEVYGSEYRDAWVSDMLRTGRMTGPRLFTTGSPIFGRRKWRPRIYRPIETLDDAREQLRWNKDHGATAIKDYAQYTRKRRHLVATAARELGLNVVSETDTDPQMNFTQLMDGVTGLEHSMGLAPFYSDVVRFFGATDAGMTPTLVVVYNGYPGEGWYHQASKLWEDPKLTRFIPPGQLMQARNRPHLWPEDMYAWQMAAAIRKLYTNGTSIQLGGHGQMAGIDAHWELDLLVKGGFTPAQALEIGTIKGAAHHGLDGQIGSLETGKLADLVILTANPLEDIGNAQKIHQVMKHGILYAGADAARVWPDPRPAGKRYFTGRP